MLRKLKQQKKHVIGLLVAYVSGILFFATTNPNELPLIMLVVPFLYLFAVFYMTILLFCRLLAIKSAVLISVVISIFAVLLLVLGSLHQLTIRDMVISLALTVLLSWYVMRLTNQRS